MSPVDMTVESKACFACARAKRKCERQIPACSRCQARGARCEYASATATCEPLEGPQVRHQQAVSVSEEPSYQFLSDLSGDSSHVGSIASDYLDALIGDPSTGAELNPEPASPTLPWYLERESWDIASQASPSTAPFSTAVLKSHMDNINEWLARWVETGTCPFIHHRTYRHHIPRCIQDAYTALSTYRNVKESNKDIITTVLEQRLKQLLADQPRPPSGPSSDEDAEATGLDTFQHLARVHALLIYQIIFLYDGDIRLRHVAETQIPTLNSWLRQLVSSAKRSAAQGPDRFIAPLITPSGHQDPPMQAQIGAGGGQLEVMTLATPSFSHEDIAWYAWLFAETIRRTWFVASSMQTIYLTLQVLWAPCPGRLPFTPRKGAFEATSSFAWAACYKGHKPGTGFARMHKHCLFEDCRPEDIDEFAFCLLECSYGTERIERWRLGK